MLARAAIAFRSIFWLLNQFRIPLAICLLLYLLYGSAQLHELTELQTIGSNLTQFVLSWVTALVYLLAFSYLVLCPSEGFDRSHPWAYDLSAGAIGSAPLVFNAVMWMRPLGGISTSLAGLAMLVLGTGAVRLIANRLRATRPPFTEFESVRFVGTLAGALGFAAATLVMLYCSVEVARTMGTFALIYAFLALLLICLVSLEYWFSRLYIPAFSVMLIALLLSSYLSYGTDRAVRRIASGIDLMADENQPLRLGDAFAAWLQCRSDWTDYVDRNKPYPVFIVAAEGGGSSAAIFAGTVLAKLQSIEPRFAEHVFAISGVSGGALGAASFVAGLSIAPPKPRPSRCQMARPSGAAQQGTLDEKELMTLVSSFTRADYLAPMIGAALFPDFLQRFNPFAAPALDRSRWIEYAMEQTWASRVAKQLGAQTNHNPFAQDFFLHWAPAAGHPALVVNVVSTGGVPMILSPFAPLPRRAGDNLSVGVGQVQAPSVRTYLEYSDAGKSIRLSTAVGMSARFPFIFSPATIPLGQAQVQFVDGGYYDNTGVNVAALLHAHLTDPKVESSLSKLQGSFNVYLISIGSFDSISDTSTNSYFSDLSVPILSLINTRRARTTNTHVVLQAVGITHIDFMLAPDNATFPLGLVMGKQTAERITKRIGEPSACTDAYRGKVVNPSFDLALPDDEKGAIAYNSCNLQAIAGLLERP